MVNNGGTSWTHLAYKDYWTNAVFTFSGVNHRHSKLVCIWCECAAKFKRRKAMHRARLYWRLSDADSSIRMTRTCRISSPRVTRQRWYSQYGEKGLHLRTWWHSIELWGLPACIPIDCCNPTSPGGDCWNCCLRAFCNQISLQCSGCCWKMALLSAFYGNCSCCF